MPRFQPEAARQFAVEVVRRLRSAGYEALWAGGCVRDQLLGKPPKDYDVATNAEPKQVRELFGHRRTLELGAAFGVITVVGKPAAGNIEVATFRCDATYSDGRHPDSISFSTAEQDALRRDFTINGLFFDPLAEQVIDYVEGQRDIQRKLVRAIGEPHARFSEDKLRILRALRFAAVLEFSLDAATLHAVQETAGDLVIVSAERIAMELRKMLAAPQRRRAVELLATSSLLEVLLPESEHLHTEDLHDAPWQAVLLPLERLQLHSFPVALALLLRACADTSEQRSQVARQVGSRWRLSHQEVDQAAWLLQHEPLLREAPTALWSKLQPLLVHPCAAAAPAYLHALAACDSQWEQPAQYLREKLALPSERLNPPPLLSGGDLIAMGLRPGPQFKQLLQDVRNGQLEGTLHNHVDARAHVAKLLGDAGELDGESDCR